MATKKPVRIAVTGAAGQIGYQLIFRIAAGDMLGPKQPVILQLLEVTPALPALGGVVMELNDCAFPLLAGIVATDDAEVAFKDADFALLVGARPRGPGMERKDLLLENAKIFSAQGKALNKSPRRTSRCWWSATRPTPTHSSPPATRRASQEEHHCHDAPRP